MTSPKVTVCLGSSRPGGIDIAFAGLAQQTFTDFEIVFVDARYHKRHAQVLAAARAVGLRQPLYHVPNHRYRTDALGESAAGFNTGFMLAAGERIVMLLDYAYCPPGWLAAHVNGPGELRVGPIETRLLVSAVTKTGTRPSEFHGPRSDVPFSAALAAVLAAREQFDEISVLPRPFMAADLDRFPLASVQETRLQHTTRAMPAVAIGFCTKNESFPREAILAVNGMDEDCDRCCLPGDTELAVRLSRLLGQPWFVREACVVNIDPRSILPKPISVMTETGIPPPPYDKHLPVHHPTCVAWMQQERLVALNPYSLRQRRETLWHWRELSLQEEAVIPCNMVPDEGYYLQEFR